MNTSLTNRYLVSFYNSEEKLAIDDITCDRYSRMENLLHDMGDPEIRIQKLLVTRMSTAKKNNINEIWIFWSDIEYNDMQTEIVNYTPHTFKELVYKNGVNVYKNTQ